MIRIGISGWNYKGWRGDFYPAGLPHSRELRYAAERFATIELNGTFYSLKKPEHYARWVVETPEDFVFAVKGSRYITHMLKGRNVAQAMANFLASGLLRLGPKLGPMLWQFPPQMSFRPERFEEFLAGLPPGTHAAARMAALHDGRMHGRAWTGFDELLNEPARAVRHAVEIRHRSFVCPEFITLLRHYNVASVCADTVEWPRLMDVTADFVYVRLHGSEVLYTSGYTPEELDNWAERVRLWAGEEVASGEHASPQPAPRVSERDVYVYFDNDAKVWAPKDAESLAQRVRRVV